MSNLKEYIPLCICKFIDKINEKYNINSDELLNIWDSISQINIKDIKLENNEKNEKKISRNEKEEKIIEKEKSSKTCIYIMKSGKNNGQACGSKISDKSQLEMFCNRHIKEEEKVIKARGGKIEKNEEEKEESVEVKPKSGKSIKDFIQPIKPEIANLVESQRQKISVIRNKFGNYEHQQTKFVLDVSDKLFYGKQIDDGRVIELNDEDISICKLYNMKFKVPTNIISSEQKKKQTVVVEDYVSSEDEDEISYEEN
jgi:hypothetical protein